MAETWRVVLSDGSVRTVDVRAGHSAVSGLGFFARLDADDVSVFAPTAREAVLRLAVARIMSVAEILAPGQLTRAEAIAAERETCLRDCRTVATLDTLSEVRPALYLEGRRRGAELCADAIRDRAKGEP